MTVAASTRKSGNMTNDTEYRTAAHECATHGSDCCLPRALPMCRYFLASFRGSPDFGDSKMHVLNIVSDVVPERWLS